MEQIITFEKLEELPPTAISLGSTLVIKTGAWKYVKPIYQDKLAPCSNACPASENIALYLKLAAEGKIEEARDVILKNNPFPAITGRVCPHPCEANCNRDKFDESVSINAIERYLGDLPAADKVTGSKKNENIAIIGSGPAGMTAAYYLAKEGYGVTIFEALSKPGGMLKIGIPDYRLPLRTLSREFKRLTSLGVAIKLNTKFGIYVKWEDMKKFSAVVIAIGFHKSKNINIEGENLDNIMPGLTFLKMINLGRYVKVGKEVAVIGGGNTAMDTARSALRMGAKVTVLYRRTRHEMPAISEEIDEALYEGVDIKFLIAPVEIKKVKNKLEMKCLKMRLGKPDASGRAKPEPIQGAFEMFTFDNIFTAIGEDADLSFADDELKRDSGLIKINNDFSTAKKGVFACGDAANGNGTVVAAISEGRKSAFSVMAYLGGKEHNKEETFEIVDYDSLKTDYFEKISRSKKQHLSVDERLNGFKEIIKRISEIKLKYEADRCFNCGICIECDNCQIFCPDIAIFKNKGEGYRVNYDYCKGCGICVTECPRNAMALENI